MAILAFQKPDKVIMLESTDKFGKFEFRPLEPGYGITIGNPLRRILLSSLEGFAITGIKIHGVEHEFATIPGVIEDVTEIILNLKQVRFKRKVEDVEDEKLTVHIGRLHGIRVYNRHPAYPSPAKHFGSIRPHASQPDNQYMRSTDTLHFLFSQQEFCPLLPVIFFHQLFLNHL